MLIACMFVHKDILSFGIRSLVQRSNRLVPAFFHLLTKHKVFFVVSRSYNLPPGGTGLPISKQDIGSGFLIICHEEKQ